MGNNITNMQSAFKSATPPYTVPPGFCNNSDSTPSWNGSTWVCKSESSSNGDCDHGYKPATLYYTNGAVALHTCVKNSAKLPLEKIALPKVKPSKHIATKHIATKHTHAPADPTLCTGGSIDDNGVCNTKNVNANPNSVQVPWFNGDTSIESFEGF